MVKIQLITSPNQKLKKNFKYLNYGCLNLSNDISKKDVLKDHPWNNRERYYQDSIKIEKIYLYTLREISNDLNNYHKIKKNLRYWKILLGPWLNSFITTYYEKNLEIEQLLKIKKKITIQISNINIEDQIPTNFFNHFTEKINNPSWHANLFSTILKKKKLGKNFLLKYINYPTVKTIRKNKINIFTSLKKKILNLLNLLFFPITRNQSLVFFNSYLSFKDKLFLTLKNFSLPIYLKDPNKILTPNFLLRQSLSNKYKKNDIYSDILRLCFLNLPKDLLENFYSIGKNVFESRITKNPKVIFTANGIYISSIQTRYIAECISNGSKLIIAQHGGRYRNIKNFFNFNHEVDICDYFVSWGGKKIKSKIKNLGIIKPIKTFKKKDGKNILFLMLSKSRFHRNTDTEINIKELYNYYNKICPNFYFYLQKKLKKNLVYRSSYINYWNEKELLKKKCKLSKIDFDRQKTELFSEAKKSKIIVCSYLSTTFLELMSANIPVILFTPFSLKGYNTETIKAFYQMEKNKIYFRNYKRAATFINKNWENIDNWWFSNKTQRSRKNFLNNFSILNQQLAQDIQSIINSAKK